MIAKDQMLTSILFLFATASCIDNSQPDTTKSGTSQMKAVVKRDTLFVRKEDLANNEFRMAIMKQIAIERDYRKLDTLITLLDKRGLSFCQFIKRLYELDDSCFALARSQFPDPSQQSDLSNVHDKAIKRAEANYMKELNLSESWALFAEVVYGFDGRIKNYCGAY
ncbi:hypothetical protein [Chitinophaga filiformis]|uniref:Uncharacterized protein n=1 Tax=Chitinophaga filiformis TaxID=104663 RepID=A0ABY4IAD6_CHIFI|nr:hypothetical protein [Chitinophaga filiformis]UPK72309.1 hypothetical protein MYF79_13525 [Chitinophaga filiformis]